MTDIVNALFKELLLTWYGDSICLVYLLKRLVFPFHNRIWFLRVAQGRGHESLWPCEYLMGSAPLVAKAIISPLQSKDTTGRTSGSHVSGFTRILVHLVYLSVGMASLLSLNSCNFTIYHRIWQCESSCFYFVQDYI